MSENLRVLYVAMTRAKEQFITFFSCDDIEKKLSKIALSSFDNGKISSYSCSKFNSDGEILLACAMLHPDGEALRQIAKCLIRPIDAEFRLSVNISESEDLEHNNGELTFVEPDVKTVELISEKLNYNYQRRCLEGLSSKLTASSLDSDEIGFEYITSSKPSFMNKSSMSPAQRGTAMHTFMQFCSYDLCERDGVERAAELLLREEFISKAQFDCLDFEKLKKFFSTNLYRCLRASGNVHREFQFDILIPACDLLPTQRTENILLQGIIDCFFENPDGTLTVFDFKTDRTDNPQELIERHSGQMSLYRRALFEITGKSVSECYIYSFEIGDAVAIPI